MGRTRISYHTFRTVVLRVWPLDQQHGQHPGLVRKENSQPHPRPPEVNEALDTGPAVCVSHTFQDSHVCRSWRTSALEICVLTPFCGYL